MKTKKTLGILAFLLFVFCTGMFAFENDASAQLRRKGSGIVPLTDNEKATMQYIREEEKLARDVYIKMFELWGATIFSNISVSEQRHMDAVLNLLVKYGIPDPTAGKAVGEFTEQSGLQAIYNELVSSGQSSLLDAFYVGQHIEEIDIEDLEAATKETDKADLDRVYGNLLNGSYNHLDAFNAHIESLDQ
jgi:hypothetical protein